MCPPSGQGKPLPHLGLSMRIWPDFGQGFGTGATGDEEQEKALALLLRLGGHFRPQCGRFQGLELALFRLTRFEIGAVFSQKPPESPL